MGTSTSSPPFLSVPILMRQMAVLRRTGCLSNRPAIALQAVLPEPPPAELGSVPLD